MTGHEKHNRVNSRGRVIHAIFCSSLMWRTGFTCSHIDSWAHNTSIAPGTWLPEPLHLKYILGCIVRTSSDFKGQFRVARNLCSRGRGTGRGFPVAAVLARGFIMRETLRADVNSSLAAATGGGGRKCCLSGGLPKRQHLFLSPH